MLAPILTSMNGSPDRRSDDVFAMPWAIAAAAVETAVDVVDLRHATRAPAPHAHCSACQGKHIEALTTPEGQLFHRCEDCHRLWRVTDAEARLVSPAKVISETRDDPGARD